MALGGREIAGEGAVPDLVITLIWRKDGEGVEAFVIRTVSCRATSAASRRVLAYD